MIQESTLVDLGSSPEISLREKLEAIRIDMLEEYRMDHGYPWIIGLSGGKDSTLVLHLVFEMILRIPPSERTRSLHVVANDTGVESPLVIGHLERLLEKLRAAARAMEVPMTVTKTMPRPNDTFWVNLIGRGYPSPNRSFRWCTDRLKIQPTSVYIRQISEQAGQSILLLGVRRSESAKRAVSARKFDNGQRLNKHNDLAGCFVYRPILELATEEVWTYLLQSRAPWGGTHRDLITLYRTANSGECPLVIDADTAPSCGTGSSRFGCWTCTVVTKDKSLEGFVDAGYPEFEPLLDFREWLAQIRNDTSLRQAVRRSGATTFQADGSLIPGPFTMSTRQEILSRLTALQQAMAIPLISDIEIELIKEIWAADMLVPSVLEGART